MQPDERQIQVLQQFLALPTAPFHEHHVLTRIRQFCAERNLPCEVDAWGNIAIRYRRGKKNVQPVVLEAHTDHPGFHVDSVDGRRASLSFLGKAPAVPLQGLTLQVRRDDDPGFQHSALITAVERQEGFYRPLKISADVPAEVRAGDFAVFDLPTWTREGDRLGTRAHDDLTQVAAIVLTLDRLAREGDDADVVGLFTRAEEVGFIGANGATRTGLIPDTGVVVALECSGLPAQRGFVVRCGDFTSVYDGWATTRLLQLADAEARRDPGFVYQTPLPRRGTCNASLYAARGYRAAGLTLPMQNYHNQGDSQVEQEQIDLRDWATLTHFLHLICTQFGPYGRIQEQVRQHVDRLWEDEKKNLQPRT